MTSILPTLSMAQPLLDVISDTAEAFRTAIDRCMVDLDFVERQLRDGAPEIEFILWEPIHHTERRFVGDGESRAADTVWRLAFCPISPGGVWRLAIQEYHREYEPVANQATVQILRSEIPVVEASQQLVAAAMDSLQRFLEQYNETLRQVLARCQARLDPAVPRASRPRATPLAAPIM